MTSILSRIALSLLFLELVSAGEASAQKDQSVRVNAEQGEVWRSMDLAASGDFVYQVWEDARNHGALENNDIYFNRSSDAGVTWLESDIRLNTSQPGSTLSTRPRIAASGPQVYVTWVERRNTREDIFFNRSLDGGLTWLESDKRLNTDGPGAARSINPEIAASGDHVYVVWEDYRDGSPDIRFNRSRDGGFVWLFTDMRLDTDLPGAGPSSLAQIVALGNSVYVVWMEGRRNSFYDPEDVHFNRSLDHGVTWLSSDMRLDSNPPINFSHPISPPQLAAAGESVYVVWGDHRNGGRDVFCNRSLDQGGTWLAEEQRVDTSEPGSKHTLNPTIAATGDSVLVAWGDFSVAGNLLFNHSQDRGASWSDTARRVDGGLPGTTGGANLAGVDGVFYMAWTSTRPGPYSPFFSYSKDGGRNWLLPGRRLSDRLVNSYVGGMAVSGDSVYVTWVESPFTTRDADIYFNIPFGSQPYGEGSVGSGGFVPRLEGSGQLIRGGEFTASVSQGLGSAVGLLALGRPGSRASIPLAGGSLLVFPIAQTRALVLDGSPGLPGVGTASQTFAVPQTPDFIGFNVNFQAVFLDPQGQAGVTLTNAVEAWIL